jgi:putative endonuclease
MDKSLTGLISYLAGYAAEKEAFRFLKKKGYRLECQNFHPKRGYGANELDLVMWDKKTLVFIEVKKRSSFSRAAEVVDSRLQKRLFKGAEAFLSVYPQYAECDCRFDVVLVVDGEKPMHLQNVIEG